MSVPRPSIDSVTTINADGSRNFLHPADARGRWSLARRLAAVALIALYVLLPWIPVRGHPAVFLDLATRRFHLFGITLTAQDAWLLFFLITGLGFALFFLTALFGRLWCGWACPQTVFLDHVFRRIERWIEGDAPARRRLDAAEWDNRKAAKRVGKHAAYLLVSAGIAHLFLSYFVSLPAVYRMVTGAPTEHWGAFVFMAAATGALYFNFAWFREQLCIVICPYGRLQSALIDDHSLVIGYDAARGEPRRGATPAEPAAAAKLGDCVDCFRCVQVCPTGIDIRQGLQMECIGCTACLDACDDVMARLKKPPGLIRYDSHTGFHGGVTRWIRSRTVLYSILLLVGAAVTGFALSTVKPAGFMPMRMPGGAYFIDADAVRNQFLVRITNKTGEPRTYRLSVAGAPAATLAAGVDETVSVDPLQEVVHAVILRLPRKTYAGPFRFTLSLRDEQGAFTMSREIEFLGPDPRLLDEDYWREKSAPR